MAGANVNMFPAKGALLIFGHRVNNMVINRCRKPADADILVPGDTICLIGTTSSRVPYEEINDMKVTSEEVNVLLREGAKLAPELAQTRILRAYAGVRPLVAADDDPSGRSISRGIVCLDHETRDGIPGFITITGGKLMTYRLMAEWATDLVCKKLGVDRKCQTAEKSLPGSEVEKTGNKSVVLEKSSLGAKAAHGRHGSRSVNVEISDKNDESLVCECEGVSVAEVNYAVEELGASNILNLRRRTRVGMGTCQGELCACRAAGLLSKANGCARTSIEDLAIFMNERWKGMFPVAWGDTLAEAQFTSWIYEGVCGLDAFQKREE
jgi:glycerol-3-phosphate dehydrogenase